MSNWSESEFMTFVRDMLVGHLTNQANANDTKAKQELKEFAKFGYKSENPISDTIKNAGYAIGYFFGWNTNKLADFFKLKSSEVYDVINRFFDKKVMWNSCRCDKSCEYCHSLNGTVFKIRNVPSTHPHCHCGIIPVADSMPEGKGPKPKYPGNDPMQPPPDYEWKGRGDVESRQGMWVNPKTGEKMREDLKHEEPIGPHWDYWNPQGEKYRIYEDGRMELVE